jgi:hypothetical protein
MPSLKTGFDAARSICVKKLRLKINFIKGRKNITTTLCNRARYVIESDRFCWPQPLDSFADTITIRKRNLECSYTAKERTARLQEGYYKQIENT